MLDIPKEFGYVILVIALQHIIVLSMMIRVRKARKTFDIAYPALYAPEGHKYQNEFNSIQRIHQNTIEGIWQVQIAMVINGLISPVTTAVFGLIYSLGRIAYMFAYGNCYFMVPSVMLTKLGDFPLTVMLFINGYKMIKA